MRVVGWVAALVGLVALAACGSARSAGRSPPPRPALGASGAAGNAAGCWELLASGAPAFLARPALVQLDSVAAGATLGRLRAAFIGPSQAGEGSPSKIGWLVFPSSDSLAVTVGDGSRALQLRLRYRADTLFGSWRFWTDAGPPRAEGAASGVRRPCPPSADPRQPNERH